MVVLINLEYIIKDSNNMSSTINFLKKIEEGKNLIECSFPDVIISTKLHSDKTFCYLPPPYYSVDFYKGDTTFNNLYEAINEFIKITGTPDYVDYFGIDESKMFALVDIVLEQYGKKLKRKKLFSSRRKVINVKKL